MKRGQVPLALFFVMGLLILIWIVFFFVIRHESQDKEILIADTFKELDQKGFASTVPLQQYDGMSLGLRMTLAYEQKKLPSISSELSDATKKTFGNDVCWKLTIAEESLKEEASCYGKKLTATTYLPSDKPLIAKLEVW